MSDMSRNPGADRISLFLALWPDGDTRQRLAASCAEALHQNGGRPVDPRRYHATLHFLGEPVVPLADIVAAMTSAGAAMRMHAFDWMLDRLCSFAGRHPPRVLCAGAIPDPLRQLRDQWSAILERAVPGWHPDRSFVPHVTVAYGNDALPQRAVTPVCWRVTRLVLLASEGPQHHYRELAGWPLA